ncbi:hypothetical protein FF1_046701 [Malus domestica]
MREFDFSVSSLDSKGWIESGYGCEGERDGRDRGHGVGRGNSTNQGLLSMGVNISNEHYWDVYCLWKKLSLKPLKRSLNLFSPTHGELPPPNPESKRLRMTHNISEIIELKFKRLHMSHKECNPRLTKNHLPRLSLVHREVVLNDLPMPLPPLSSQIIRKRRWEELKTLWLLVHLHQWHLHRDDESTRRHEG